MGADVIKIEPKGGDMTRQLPPNFIAGDSAYFHSVNRNKKSVVIDYPSDIRQISTSNPDVVDASPVTAREILLHGKGLGNATLVVWSKSGERTFYNVTVDLNLDPLRHAGILSGRAGDRGLCQQLAGDAAAFGLHNAGGEAFARKIFLGQHTGRLVESFSHKRPFWWYVPVLAALTALPLACGGSSVTAPTSTSTSSSSLIMIGVLAAIALLVIVIVALVIIVFFAVGFETTAPANAMAVWQSAQLGLDNFSILVSHVLVPPAMTALLDSPKNQVQAFLAAGHVCAVMGWTEYEPIAAKYRVTIAVTGFEPLDILQGVFMCVKQLEEGRAEVENQYVGFRPWRYSRQKRWSLSPRERWLSTQ